MPDTYDEMVAYLTKHPEEIHSAWVTGSKPHPCHPLFAHANKSRSSLDGKCGCLTQIRATHKPNYWDRKLVAETDSLTKRILADNRIPDGSPYNRPDLLPVFAEWQRIIDAELDREPPVFDRHRLKHKDEADDLAFVLSDHITIGST